MPRHLNLASLLVATLIAVAPAAGAAELTEISTQERGVMVRVKPTDLGVNATAWIFEVRFDTHSQELSDDLAQISVLIDDSGRKHAALAWDGTPAGGHHRNGVLKFAPIRPLPATLELQIARPGEPAPRSFKWSLK